MRARSWTWFAATWTPQRLADEREAVIRARYRPFGWDQAFAEFDGLVKRFAAE